MLFNLNLLARGAAAGPHRSGSVMCVDVDDYVWPRLDAGDAQNFLLLRVELVLTDVHSCLLCTSRMCGRCWSR